MKKVLIFLIAMVCLFALLLGASQASVQAQESVEDPDLVALGKALFFDTNLSVNRTQSCASCHAPEVGFTGPDALINAHGTVYEGALEDRFGNRKPPASAYAGFSPILYYDEEEGDWIGGMFYDGRASGEVWGDPLAEQAGGPFLNPLEQALPDAKQLVLRVAKSSYADLFVEVWGPGSLDPVKDVDGSYERIARSVAAYERSAEVNPFNSKFDLFWENAQAAGKDVTKIKWSGGGGMGGGGMGGGGMGGGGNADPNRWQNFRGLGLSDAELQGLAAFNDPNRANCASCHSLVPPEGADYPIFTDHSYVNLGIPKNPENPFYSMPEKWNPDGFDYIDPGLGAYLQSAGYPEEIYSAEMGKFKVPTLRNVDLRPSPDFVKAYGHNGYFKSLSEIVLFYTWRGMMDGGCEGMGGGGMGSGGMGGGMGGCGGMGMDMFPEPEYDLNRETLKHFPMMDVPNIVLFMQTLSDGYFERSFIGD